MMKNLNRIIGIAGALAIIGASLVALRDNDAEDGAMYARIAPPAQDSLVQAWKSRTKPARTSRWSSCWIAPDSRMPRTFRWLRRAIGISTSSPRSA